MSSSAQTSSLGQLLSVEGDFAPRSRRASWRFLLACVLAGGVLYGVCMGSWQVRPLQQLFSAIKTPLLISAGGLFCLPSFYVVNTLLGLRDDLPDALRGVFASQAVAAVCLASLGPIVLVLYSGLDNYQAAKAINGVLFFLSSLAGQIVLARHYRTLIQRDKRHGFALVAWLVSFWFVTIQLAWMLRPFIGRPEDPTTFFRSDTWGNAYVEVWKAVSGALSATP